jgi:uncharacterized membrane protein
MTSYQLLTIAHVAAAIVFVGTVTVATSRFPRAALERDAGAAAEHHRVTVAYGSSALVVPVLGLALAQQSDRLGEAWVQTSLGLVVVAGVLLAVVIVPEQRRILALNGEDRPGPTGADLARLRGASGILSLLWSAALVLMVVQPW